MNKKCEGKFVLGLLYVAVVSPNKLPFVVLCTSTLPSVIDVVSLVGYFFSISALVLLPFSLVRGVWIVWNEAFVACSL